jgi:hypothetical protein
MNFIQEYKKWSWSKKITLWIGLVGLVIAIAQLLKSGSNKTEINNSPGSIIQPSGGTNIINIQPETEIFSVRPMMINDKVKLNFQHHFEVILKNPNAKNDIKIKYRKQFSELEYKPFRSGTLTINNSTFPYTAYDISFFTSGIINSDEVKFELSFNK